MTPIRLLVLKAFAVFLAAASLAFADGRAVLFRQHAGPFLITVFGNPSPLQAGNNEVSVMPQNAADNSNIMDATVRVRLLRKTAESVTEVMAPAKQGQGNNKLLYSARVKLSATGEWRLEVDVTARGEAVNVASAVNVLPEQPAAESYWPFFVLIPTGIVLFVLNRWLRRRWNIRHPRARP